MPPVMAALVAIGGALGAPTAAAGLVGGLAVAGTGAAIGMSANQSARAATAAQNQSRDAAKAAAENNAATLQAFKDSKNTASTNAVNAVRRRTIAASQSVFTSPLGITTEADTTRKTLLGQ